MKKYLLLFSLLFTMPAFAQTPDSVAVRRAALDYIEGFYTADAARMSRAIHPELAKRIVTKSDKGEVMLRNMGSSELVFNTRKFVKPTDASGVPFRAVVEIFDLSHDVATVKVTTNKLAFFDYLHLGKVQGEWKIINVLWARIGP